MLRTMAQAHEVARYANSAGFDSLWISHSLAVDPIAAFCGIAQEVDDLAELGTSVVPLYGRHPVGLAQLTMTAQSALNGRFTLGIGAASKSQAEDRLGLSWDKPYSFTRDFVDAMEPLLRGEETNFDGELLTAHAALDIDAPQTPILLAALGPRMLRFAGARLAGTSLGQCGPKTIASYVAPTLYEAAEKAGRDKPRIMALVRINVTDDRAGAFALAKSISERYQAIPSYAAVLAKEGLAEPADLHLIGSWQQILDGLAEYAKAGVSDLRVEVATHTPKAREETRAALAE